ncbi:peptide chain release factor N(5)-glutamine methyltransferase [Marinomonas pollencensis]|uniref:Release factor glutamine methyltransferase n=1 Tax=Marinomonas pollencensis TaxID=491954 RepID=A0A3E0DLQ3_9GAMM|nr:peptide chain release factor N(5)-glutamine methyltransferase [Marinomonas pollencensis]REG83014.1 [protein release factor]-glutamine N5-methyltransferase [Marinomonas pollencensis]
MRIDEQLKGAYERLTFVSDTAKLDAQLLLAHVLGVTSAYFYTWPDKVLTSEQIDAFERLLIRREQGEPIAYILQQQAFWTLDLEVAQCTLIPRADTERLVEVALALMLPEKAYRILDLGTGTGAIALALASESPKSSVTGIDFNQDAVALAKRNALRNRLDVEFLQSSWFEQLAPCHEFNLIVSNPPYIDPNDEHLAQGDVRFEPKSALVSAEQGLADILHIIAAAPNYLAESGYLVFEHGYDQAEAVRAAFLDKGYSDVKTYQDLAGNDRVTQGRKAGN